MEAAPKLEDNVISTRNNNQGENIVSSVSRDDLIRATKSLLEDISNAHKMMKVDSVRIPSLASKMEKIKKKQEKFKESMKDEMEMMHKEREALRNLIQESLEPKINKDTNTWEEQSKSLLSKKLTHLTAPASACPVEQANAKESNDPLSATTDEGIQYDHEETKKLLAETWEREKGISKEKNSSTKYLTIINNKTNNLVNCAFVYIVETPFVAYFYSETLSALLKNCGIQTTHSL